LVEVVQSGKHQPLVEPGPHGEEPKTGAVNHPDTGGEGGNTNREDRATTIECMWDARNNDSRNRSIILYTSVSRAFSNAQEFDLLNNPVKDFRNGIQAAKAPVPTEKT